MDIFDCIIIGAGPAGLFCGASITFGEPKRILILEKNQTAGKKLLISGSGRCNITHTGNTADFLKHYEEGASFMKPAFSAFSNETLIGFLHDSGIPTEVMDNGKVFPSSMNSQDVLSVLLRATEKNNCVIKYNEAVIHITSGDELFEVSTKQTSYASKSIVIAAGGASYIRTGSNGDSYRFVESLGHPIREISPALTHFLIKNYKFQSLAGVSIPAARCSVLREGRAKAKGIGDVLFTHTGLSGPGVLDLSRSAAKGDTFCFSLIPMKQDEFTNDFITRSRSEGKKSLLGFLKNYGLPESLAHAVLSYLSVDSAKHVSEVSKNERKNLAAALCGMSFEIDEKGGWDSAMVTTGGASIEHVNSKTMESRLVPGLYIIGEALDIDGASGGYNLQACFSTGFLAAQSIGKV